MLETFNDNEFRSIHTIDIEGDGLHRSINQKLFPDGCHLDPYTRIWCVTFTMRATPNYEESIYNEYQGKFMTRAVTYVCKLPDHVRALPRPYWIDGIRHICTTAKHLKSTIVPRRIDALDKLSSVEYEICTIPDYVEFLSYISDIIDNRLPRTPTGKNLPLISKGYGNYNYDYLVLKNACDKHGIKFDGSSMIHLSDVPNLNSTEQVEPGNNRPNQEYMNIGVQHNIEDALKLSDYVYNNSNYVKKLINNKIRQQQMNQDFTSAEPSNHS
jgi:hypothetical protein